MTSRRARRASPDRRPTDGAPPRPGRGRAASSALRAAPVGAVVLAVAVAAGASATEPRRAATTQASLTSQAPAAGADAGTERAGEPGPSQISAPLQTPPPAPAQTSGAETAPHGVGTAPEVWSEPGSGVLGAEVLGAEGLGTGVAGTGVVGSGVVGSDAGPLAEAVGTPVASREAAGVPAGPGELPASPSSSGAPPAAPAGAVTAPAGSGAGGSASGSVTGDEAAPGGPVQSAAPGSAEVTATTVAGTLPPAVTITSPVAGQKLPRGCTVVLAGRAVSTAEATVVWTLRRGGTVLNQGPATVEGSDGLAAEIGTTGSWEVMLDLAAGSYSLEVRVPDDSDGEGKVMPATTTAFTVG